ncbi:MAG: hypothetical protein HZB51_31795 [Chloroflexi bacterium]|nr:hypothetical protein [Chloroflexota bacterium]
MAHRLRSLIVRSAIAALIAWILISLPIPQIPARTWFAFVQVPVVIFVLICYIGKLLIDTFFYDRYKP